MKLVKIVLTLIVFLLLGESVKAQQSGGFGHSYFADSLKMSKVTVLNAMPNMARRGFVANENTWVRWNGTAWVNDDQVIYISGCSAPAITPGNIEAKLAQNACGELYGWNGSSWYQFDRDSLNELQYLDTVLLQNDTIYLSLFNDGVPASAIYLGNIAASSIYTGSDTTGVAFQTVTIDSVLNFAANKDNTQFNVDMLGTVGNYGSRFRTRTDSILAQYFDIAGTNTFSIGPSGIVINSTSPDRLRILGNDARYGADYSGTYSDRSLIDKGFADSTYIGVANDYMAATAGQVLKWNGTRWIPGTDNSGSGGGGSPSYGEFYINSSDPDTLTIVAGTPKIVVGATSGLLADFTVIGGSRLVYTGVPTIDVQIIAAATLDFNAVNQSVTAWWFKNNTAILKSEASDFFTNTSAVGEIVSTAVTSVSTNDTLDVRFDASVNGTVIVFDLNAHVTSIASALGEANVAANIGNGLGVYASKLDSTLQFKTLHDSTGVIITADANELFFFADTAVVATLNDVSVVQGTIDAHVAADLDLDNTNEIQTLSIDSVTVSAGLERFAVSASGSNTVYFNSEDRQDLSLSANILSLTNDATTVDLSPYVNTDDQTISVDSITVGSIEYYTISLESANSVVVSVPQAATNNNIYNTSSTVTETDRLVRVLKDSSFAIGTTWASGYIQASDDGYEFAGLYIDYGPEAYDGGIGLVVYDTITNESYSGINVYKGETYIRAGAQGKYANIRLDTTNVIRFEGQNTWPSFGWHYNFPNANPSFTLGDTSILAWIGTGAIATPGFIPKPSGGGGGITDLSIEGVGPTYTIASSTGNDVIIQGVGITLSESPANTLVLTAADQSATNELQNLFQTIQVSGQSDVVADGQTDILTLASGTGITIATTAASDLITITNSAPDQTVVLNNGTGISVSGSYPTFTITNTVTNTDAQTLSIDSTTVTGGERYAVSISNGNTIYLVDDNTIQTISAGDGSGSDKTINLSDGGGSVVLREGSNVTFSRTADTITIGATPGAGTTDLTFTGASSPYTLNSSTGTDVTFAAGTGISLSRASNELTITSTVTDTDTRANAEENNVSVLANPTAYDFQSGFDVAVDGSEVNVSLDLSEITEQVQDNAWNVLGGTQTGITVTYNDAGNNVSFVAADVSATNEIQNLSYTASTGAIGISSGTGTTIPVMVGATAGSDGERGLVPKPLLGEQNAFLRGDGTWANPSVGGDNWGAQVVQVTARLTGDGTGSSPLDIAQQAATSGQALKWSGTTWAPADDDDTHVPVLEGVTTIVSDPIGIAFGPGFDVTNAASEADITLDLAEVTEQVQDQAWGGNTLTGTQTGITVTYNDAGDNVSFVVTDASTTNEVQNLSYTASTGTVSIDLGGTAAVISVMTNSTRGLVPDGDGVQDGEFLREDGTWAVPGGGGNVSGSGADNQVVIWTGTNTVEGDVDLIFDGTNLGIGGTPSYSLDVQSTGGARLPVGTTAQRPAGANGLVRYNTDSSPEGLEYYYAATTWARIPKANLSETISGAWTYSNDVTYSGTSVLFNSTLARFNESNFTIIESSANGAAAKFETNLITAATTRTYSFPDANGTLALLSDIVDNSTTNELQNLNYVASTGAINITSGTGTSIPALLGASGVSNGEQGLAPKPFAGEEGYFLRGDASWVPVDVSNTNEIQNLSYTAATGAIGISGGSGTTIPVMTSSLRGLVPDGDGAGTDEFLREDATWGVPPGTAALTVQNASNPQIGTTTSGTVFQIIGGSGISVAGDGTNVTISATGGSANYQTWLDEGVAATTQPNANFLATATINPVLTNDGPNTETEVTFNVVDGSIGSTQVADNSLTASDLSVNVVSSVDGVTNDGGNIDLVQGGIITITPDDGANTITISATEAQQLFNTIQVAGQSDIVADGVTDILTITAGTGISLTTNATTDALTINSTVTDTDDQSLSIGGTGPTYTLDIDGGTGVTFSATGITLSESPANTLVFTAADQSATNEVQNLSYTAATGTVSIDLGGTSAVIPVMTATTRGLVPDGDGSGTDEFLREDGTWAVPSGAADGNGIYSGNGTTPSNTTVTLTDQLLFTGDVANTNSIATRLTVQTNSSGAVTTGFGGAILFQGESATVTNRDMARIGTAWTTAVDANREAKLSIELGDNGGALSEIAYFNRISSSSGTFGINGSVLVGATSSATISNSSFAPGTTYTFGGNTNPVSLTGTSTTSATAVLLSATGNNTNASGTIGNSTFTTTSGNKYAWRVSDGFIPSSGTGTFANMFFNGTFNQTGGANGIVRNILLTPTLTSIADYKGITFNPSYTASSGSGATTALEISPTFNLTGTASGIQRGVHINPTLTSLVSQFRAVDISVNNANAYGIYQSGASTINQLIGTTYIGGSTTPSGLRFLEGSGSGINYTGFIAPTTLGSNQMYTLPSDVPSNGEVLTWNTGDQLSWEPAGGLADADYGDITVSGGVWNIDAGVVGNTEIASGAGGIYKGSGTAGASNTTVTVNGVAGSLSFLYDGGVTGINITDGTGVYISSEDNATQSLWTANDIDNFTSGGARIKMTGANIALQQNGGNITFGGGTASTPTRWLEPSASGTNYFEIQAAAMASNVSVIWPTSLTDGVMKNTTGQLSFSKIAVSDLANGTDGELITWDATGTPATVAVGTAGQVLTSNGPGAAPTFQAAPAANSVYTASGTLFSNGVATLTDDATFTFDYFDGSNGLVFGDVGETFVLSSGAAIGISGNSTTVTINGPSATSIAVSAGNITVNADNTSIVHRLALTGDNTPAQITANQNDYNPTGLADNQRLRLSTDASRNITGIVPQNGDGDVLTLFNVGSFDIVLTDEDALSAAANRFDFAGSNHTLTPGKSMTLVYDDTDNRWRPISFIPEVGSSGVTATNGADDRIAIFTGANTIEGDADLVFDGTQMGIATAVSAGYALATGAPIRSSGILQSNGAGTVGSTTAAAGVRINNTTGLQTLNIGVANTDEILFVTADESTILTFSGGNANFAYNVGIGGAPAASAALSVTSTSQVFYAPRMTTAQRTAISGPTDGAMVYDTDIDNYYVVADGQWTPVGGIQKTATESAAFTFAMEDIGRWIHSTSASAINATIPLNSSVAFPIGTVIQLYQEGAGQVTVVATGGVTLRAPNGAKTSAQYTNIFIRKIGTDEWVVGGSTAP